MKILVTGGCGYTGVMLVNELLNLGHDVVVVDVQWFGNTLQNHKHLTVHKMDIRDTGEIPLQDVEIIYHLANVANDPSVDLNPTLSWEINVLSSYTIADLSSRAGIKKFIYASSGSVYGVKKEKDVTEDLPLLPISTYNQTKMTAERVIKSYEKDIKIHCIRPATVCGFSPRMRLDVSVNMLTFQALKYKSMTVFGGQQVRPNIHIQDLIDVYKHFILNPKIPSGFYNAGFENLKIIEIAQLVSKTIPAKIEIKNNNDPRSYRQNSDKLIATGFKKNFSVEHAIKEIKNNYEKKRFIESDKCYTVKWMKELNL